MLLYELLINTSDSVVVYKIVKVRGNIIQEQRKELYRGYSKKCDPLLLHREIVRFGALKNSIIEICVK